MRPWRPWRSRRPIVEALAGRPAPPQPAHRIALLGTALAAAGLVALILAETGHTVMIVAGIVASTAGMLLLAPLGIRALAALAAAQQAHDHTLTGGNLPTTQLIVWLANPNNQGGPGMSAAPAGGATGTPAVPQPAVVASARSKADAIAQAVGRRTVVELDSAIDLNSPVPAGAPPDAGQASLVHSITEPGGGQG